MLVKKTTQNIGSKKFGKIGLVTAEILLIWTNVTRTYDAWTSVTMIVVTC